MIDIRLLRDRSRLKKYSRGSVISGSGNGVVMFAVLKGEVCIISGYATPKVEKISMLGDGAFYIDAALVDDDKAGYTAIAVNDAVILPIDKKSLYDFMHEEPEIAGEIVRELSSRRDCTAVTARAGKDEIVRPGLPCEDSAADHELFPEGHGACALPVDKQDETCLMNKNMVCPICDKPFKAVAVRSSKLMVDHVDSDMRYRYKGVEPLYYDAVTCPNCFYSALQDVFLKPERRKQDIERELPHLVGGMDQAYPSLAESDAVFARYYLALRCAPLGFVKHYYMTAKLLYILSRLYQDAGNKVMEDETVRRALEAFLSAYQNERMSPKQEQQVCVLIGELYLKQNDPNNAAAYFYKAKTNGDKTSFLGRHAENRIYDIRTMASVQA